MRQVMAILYALLGVAMVFAFFWAVVQGGRTSWIAFAVLVLGFVVLYPFVGRLVPKRRRAAEHHYLHKVMDSTHRPRRFG